MTDHSYVAIIDYGMGNLFSVRQACTAVGLAGVVTNDPAVIRRADGVILPGVGAMGRAMSILRDLALDKAIYDFVDSGRPFMGICLGFQLLMSESEEFGKHKGLNIIKGSVIRFNAPREGDRIIKVPQVQWNRILVPQSKRSWTGTPLEGLENGTFQYFIHSYYPVVSDSDIVLSETKYGEVLFCSCILFKNIFACQFHPERSGIQGLKIYQEYAKTVNNK